MLGLNNSVSGQVIINTENTDWSQWRYVVKLWFCVSGTSSNISYWMQNSGFDEDIPRSTIKRV